jgi:hypothetical protein
VASEILNVPEEHLGDVIAVIRAGLVVTDRSNIKKVVRRQLKKWCDDEEEYLERLRSDDDE